MKLEWGRFNDPERIYLPCDYCGRTVSAAELRVVGKGETTGTEYRACERCVRAWKAGRS